MAAERGEFVFFPGLPKDVEITDKPTETRQGKVDPNAGAAKRELTVEDMDQSLKTVDEDNLKSFQKKGVKDAEQYFPHSVGSTWRYQGQTIATQNHSTSRNSYVNVVSIRRTEVFKGHTLTVRLEANSGNRGQLATSCLSGCFSSTLLVV